ncbi:hypothetical protein EDB19DRAFT_2038201 [Suillus lakei]|nr:hypothetical protein EDB19DRAFT_2038201 [Suillus lakei]
MDIMTTQSVTFDSLQAQQAVFVAIASFTVLCWDHMITFADEVAWIWCKRKGPLGYLFLLVRETAFDVSEITFYFESKNRYITPLGFVVNIVALTLPTWSIESCRNFVRYEGAMATIGVSIAQLIMLLRIYVLYRGNRLAIAIPCLLFLVWVALEAYVMARGEMVPMAQQVHSCREVYDLPLTLSAARAWMPLTYDSAVFAMTLWHTLPIVRNKGAGRILLTFLLDGTLYYAVICSANLALTVMIVRAPQGQKGIAAQLVFLLTVVMTSRVTLNLKKQAETPAIIISRDQRRHYSSHSPLSKSVTLFGSRQTPNPQLQSQCPTFVSCTPVSLFVSMDADLMDDAQSLGDELPNRTCADVESQ